MKPFIYAAILLGFSFALGASALFWPEIAFAWEVQEPTFLGRVSAILSTGFGTFIMVFSGAVGAVCLLMGTGGSKDKRLLTWGLVCLGISGGLFAIRMLVTSGTMDLIELRRQR